MKNLTPSKSKLLQVLLNVDNRLIIIIYFYRVAEEKIKPMVTFLEKLRTDIEYELEMVDYCKANIIKNKNHINYLITERFTLKNI